jgi:transposase-like protein
MTTSEQRRLTNWRLKILQVAASAGNVARTCRHFAISRKTFYTWRQRYHEHGDAGLADRARAPHDRCRRYQGGSAKGPNRETKIVQVAS